MSEQERYLQNPSTPQSGFNAKNQVSNVYPPRESENYRFQWNTPPVQNTRPNEMGEVTDFGGQKQIPDPQGERQPYRSYRNK
jgi:hypothetical protein